MKRILVLSLIILVSACNDDDKDNENVNGIYTSGKVGVLIDTTHPEREAFFIEYNADNQKVDTYQDVSEEINNIVIAGECNHLSCDLNRELIGNLVSGELLLTDNSTGLSKSYIKQPSSADISSIVGITMSDDFSGTLEVAADHSFSATTSFCPSLIGTLQRYNYYYELEATASGCTNSNYNGDYSGIGFSAEIENKLTVFVYMSNEHHSLYGSFHE